MSWKKYGGTTKYENLSNIKNHSITTDNFSLLGVVYGVFNISGILNVTETVSVGGDVTVGGNTSLGGYLNVGEQLTVQGTSTFADDVSMQKTLTVYEQLYLDKSQSQFLHSTVSGIGLNTNTPDAAFTISSGFAQAFNAYSNTPTAHNIIAQNSYGRGISVNSDISKAYIDFFENAPNNTHSTSTIRSITGGYLEIDNLNKFAVLASTSIAPSALIDPTNSGKRENVNNETLVVYDTFDNSYLYQNYFVADSKKGNGISIISADNSSVTFLNINAPNKRGGGIGGGVVPYDKTKSLLTAGLTTGSGEYIPHNTIVSGVYPNRLRATMGVNTYRPLNDYIMDINGPVHLQNGECFVADMISPFIVNRAAFYKNNRQYGYACCSNIRDNSGYHFPVLSTADTSGIYWNTSLLPADSDNINKNIKFNAISIYNESTAFIGGSDGYIYYTKDTGDHWIKVLGAFTLDPNNPILSMNSMYASNKNSSTIRLFCSLVYTASYENIYIDMSLNNPNVNGHTAFYINNNKDFIAPSVIDGVQNSSYVWITQNSSNHSYIYKCSINNLTVPVATYTFSFGGAVPLVDIYVVSDLYVLSITKNTILSIIDGSQNIIPHTWNTSTQFTQIDCLDTTNNIVFDLSNTPLYTTDGATTWKYIDYSILNSNGMADIVFYPSSTRISAMFYDIDNIVVINKNRDSSGCTFYYCYLPEIFDFGGNKVLDIVGNVQQSGVVHQW